MTKFRQEIENEDGWSDWIHPSSDGYKILCCDCGLVHDLEFRIADDGVVNFRASQNRRSTGQVRRHRQISEAVKKVLHNPENSKTKKLARNEALTMRNNIG